jgi:hypothetical protein
VLLNAITVVMLKGPIGLDLPLSSKKPIVLGISAGFLGLATLLQAVLVAITANKNRAVDTAAQDKEQ